jgi:hypothetical protein
MHTNELHGTKFRLIKNYSLYDLPTGINSRYDFFAESLVLYQWSLSKIIGGFKS